MMKMLNCALTITGVTFAATVWAADCQTPPDCAILGFTKQAADCSAEYLKCPWDTSKVFCDEALSVPEIPCKVGSPLYGNGKCYAVAPEGKRPIAVVFDTQNRLAAGLYYLVENAYRGWGNFGAWSSWAYDGECKPAIESCALNNAEGCANSGRKNTDALLQTCENNILNSVNLYEPAYCRADFCRAGKWFIPSINELHQLYQAKKTVETTLAATEYAEVLKPEEMNRFWLCSSSWYNNNNTMILNIDTGSVYYQPNQNDTYCSQNGICGVEDGYCNLRPVIKY